MIPRAHVTAWRAKAPWLDEAQVEQDLVLSRALVELFNEPNIAGTLAFRGGTSVSRAEFEANIASKLENAAFLGDIGPLLAAAGSALDVADPRVACERVGLIARTSPQTTHILSPQKSRTHRIIDGCWG